MAQGQASHSGYLLVNAYKRLENLLAAIGGTLKVVPNFTNTFALERKKKRLQVGPLGHPETVLRSEAEDGIRD